MRTPNKQCILCKKPLYRRRFEVKKARYFACMDCRDKAKKLFPLTGKQLEALKLGRIKGDNHLTGIPKKQTQKDKMSRIMRDWCRDNPELLAKRGQKIRGENHYLWKGGISNLNQSIRQMNEYRNWQRKMKRRDKKCICGSTDNLESHHLIPLKVLIEIYKITNKEEARACKELWSMKNGLTLCRKCHYKIDNRKYED